MSIDLTLGRVNATYHLFADDLDRRDDLDGLLERVVRHDLPRELERGGVPPAASICIRRVDVHIEYDPEADPRHLERAWTRAFLAAITERMSQDDPDVRIFRTVAEARAEAIRSALRNDLTALWSWQQAGVVAAGVDTPGGVIADVLADEPQCVLRLLAPTEGAVSTAAIVRVVGVQPVAVALARVMDAIGARVSLEQAVGALVDAIATNGSPPRTSHERSPSTASGDHDPDRPERNDTTTSDARSGESEVISALVCLAMFIAHDPLVLRRVDSGPSIARLATELGLVSRPGSDELPGEPNLRPGTTEDERVASARPGPESGDRRSHGPHGHPADLAHPAEEEPAVEQVDDVPGSRPMSDVAGVLFLIPIVRQLDAMAELADEPLLSGRSTRWIAHRLGIALTAVGDRDPAVLAFAGFEPDSPELDELDPPTDPEREVIHSVAGRIADRLAVTIERPDDPPAVTLAAVVGRAGWFTFAPGWVDVEFESESIDIDVRRAALDLDPGFVAWTGTVLRFNYV